jgi:hypothetical protein
MMLTNNQHEDKMPPAETGLLRHTSRHRILAGAAPLSIPSPRWAIKTRS